MNGAAEPAGRIQINELAGLVDALASTKSSHFKAEFPQFGTAYSFSTLGARNFVKGILDPCLDFPARSADASLVLHLPAQ